jgi:S-formylglutathione hydrolase FrmB
MKESIEIYLAATHPDEARYGFMPKKPCCPDSDILKIQFPYEVWYNEEWRDTTMKIIRPELRAKNILIGFSKSGIGALNIAIDNPDTFHSVVIFDAPLMHQDSSDFNLKKFYSQETWESDQPSNKIEKIKLLAQNTEIIHISGGGFSEQHKLFQKMLEANEIPQKFIHMPEIKHHWDSGWVQKGMEAVN